MTDLEFYELRYSGKAASVVRGFRAVYLGLFFNCFIMGMVTLAACKIANILFGLPPWQSIVICGLLNVVFAAHSGLWGVLVIDMVQFFIKMTAVVAAAYFGLVEVARHTGAGEGALAGLRRLVSTLGGQQVNFQPGAQPVLSAIDGRGQPVLDILPNFALSELALMIFIVPIAIGWWANCILRGARRRQLYRATHARLEIREGFAGWHPVFQPRALRAAPLAVDHHRALLDHHFSRIEGYPGGLPGRGPAAHRP